MLSAVAARKARLAQTPQQSPAPTSAPSPPAPTSPPPSKRKPRASAVQANKRIKREHKRSAKEKPARYFAQQDAFETQEDVLVVDRSASEDEDESDDSGSSSRDALVRLPSARTRKTWSPSAPVLDSSDEDDEDLRAPVILDVPIPQPVDIQAPSLLSSFQPVLNHNVFHLNTGHSESTPGSILLLRASETLALLGTYTVTILRGSISLAGVTLTTSSTVHPVFAPRSSPIPLIECLPHRPSSSSPPIPVSLPPRAAEAVNDHDAVVLLRALDTGIEGLGRICRTFDRFFTPSRWHRDQPRFDFGINTVYSLSHRTPDVTPLLVPSTWDEALSAALPVPANDHDLSFRGGKYLVKGPKNAGKSTLARLLFNRLLTRFRRVAYLECDLGQSQFTPGGMVSLNIIEQPVFGPPFSHLSVPYAAHFVGSTSPRDCPSHYLDSIQALMQVYHLDIENATFGDESSYPETDGDRIASSIPLVVNTMGWTKGLGADLSRKVEEIVEPTDIISFTISSSLEDDWTNVPPSYASAQVSHGGPRTYAVEPVPPSTLTSHYTAADHRTLSMLSYFYAVFPCTSPSLATHASLFATRWNTSLPLCAQAPYEVDWGTAFDKIILTGAGMEDVVPSEVHRALNGSIVALVNCDPGTLDIDSESATAPYPGPSLPYTQGAAPPSPHTSRCIGLALVRALSTSSPRPRLQLLTPVPPHLLGSARVLVMGELQLPVWGMVDFHTLDDGGDVAGYERGKVPYLRWGKGEGVGGERRRVRRNLMRKGQM